MDILPVETKVTLDNENGKMTRKGTVSGHGFVSHASGPQLVYLVTLEEGFYSPQDDCYVGMIVADPSVVHTS